MSQSRSLSRMNLEKWVCLKLAPTFLFTLILATGCDWRELIRPQTQKKQVQEQSEKAALPSNDVLTRGEKFEFHRWMIREMQEQIFARPPQTGAGIDGWANVLSQRGSIEGVYHGFVLSSEYYAMEQGRADMRALRFFAQEMAALDHPNLVDSAEPVSLARDKYAKEYMGVPLFTLKRLLGDRILKESGSRKDDKENLASWYASFAVRWAKMGVSFGLPQRNSEDEAFHFKWARENNLGMIQWELLNRVHRVLNAYGGIIRPEAVQPKSSPNPAGK